MQGMRSFNNQACRCTLGWRPGFPAGTRAGQGPGLDPEGWVCWLTLVHQVLLATGPGKQLAVPGSGLQGAGVHSNCTLPGNAARPTCKTHTTASQRCVKESHHVDMPQSSELADWLACRAMVTSRMRVSRPLPRCPPSCWTQLLSLHPKGAHDLLLNRFNLVGALGYAHTAFVVEAAIAPYSKSRLQRCMQMPSAMSSVCSRDCISSFAGPAGQLFLCSSGQAGQTGRQ